MSTPRLHPWLQRIITTPNSQEHYVQLRRFIPGDDMRASDTVINYVKLQNALGGGGGSGGGGAVAIHDWEPMSSVNQIELKPNYASFGPITQMPPGVTIEPNKLTVSINEQEPYGSCDLQVGRFSNPDSFYFFWKPEPIQGDTSFVNNSVAVRDKNTNTLGFALQCQESVGIAVTNNIDTVTYVLPGYVFGQPILIEYSHDDHTLHLTTSTETGSVQLPTTLSSEYDLMITLYMYFFDTYTTSSASASISSTDIFDSGLTPSPGMSPLELLYDDPLPPAAKPGDFLYVWVDGEWGGNSYEYDQVALVIANGLVQAAAPLGVNRTILQQAIDLIKPQYGDMDVSIGDGGTYPSHYELYEAIGDRALSGEWLTVNLMQSPFADAPDVRLHFPTFENVTIRVARSIVGTLDLGSTNLEIIGGDTPVHLKNFNVDTLGSLVGEFIQLSQSQINTQGFCLNRWSASSNSSVNVVETPHWNGAPRSVQKELRNCLPDKIPANDGGGDQPSSLTVNSSPLDTRDVEVLGSSLDFTLTTTHPVKTGGGVIKSLDLNYTGGDGETYLDGALITASGGSVVYVKSLDYGNANIRFAVAVQDGGIISVNTSNISGTMPPVAYANQLPNVPNDSGLVMMDTAIPANAQIIPLSVYRSSETVANGNNLASFYVPYPLYLIGVRAALDTAPVGTDSVSVSLTGVGATPDYLIGPILISADQNANGEGMNVVLNPTDVIIEGTRLIVNVPAVDGSTAKGLTVYLIVIPAEISPRPA